MYECTIKQNHHKLNNTDNRLEERAVNLIQWAIIKSKVQLNDVEYFINLSDEYFQDLNTSKSKVIQQ